MKQLNTLDEVKGIREKLQTDFHGDIPNYLNEYLDGEEKRILEARFFYERKFHAATNSKEDKIAYKIAEEEQFWEDNSAEIIKAKKPVKDGFEVNYEQPPLAEERIDDERDLTPDETEALKIICRDDLYLFAIRYFPHYLKRPSSRLHKFLYRTLAKEINKYPNGCRWAIAAPRAGAKSSIVSAIFPIWLMCYEKKRFIIMLSNTASQVEDFIADIKRELEYNVKLKQDFPQVCGKGPMWRTNEIVTNNYVKLLGLGTGNQIRGRRFGVHRPSCIILDDGEDREMVISETQRHNIRYEWFNKDVLFAGGEQGTQTDIFVVGTVLGKDSLLNNLLTPAEYPDWQTRRFSAVLKFSTSPLWDTWGEIFKNTLDEHRKENALKFFEKNKEEMLKGTEVLWPDGDPYYNLMIYRLTNPSGFAAEKQNSPLDPSAILVPEGMIKWKYFSNIPEIQEVLTNRRRGLWFGALDPSLGKKTKSGDYSVICTLVRDLQTGTIFVVDFIVKRWSVEQQIEAILDAHEKYKYRLFAIETNAFQYVVAQNLRKRSKERGVYIPIQEVIQYQDKKMRFEGVVPFIADGTIVFDRDKFTHNQQYQLAIDQITSFSGIGDEHDDSVDSLQLTFEIAKSPRFKMLNKLAKEE